MNLLYEKIAAMLISAFVILGGFVAWLKDRREKRRDDKSAQAPPSIEKCAIKEEVDEQFQRTREEIYEQFQKEREEREKVKDKLNDAFVQIGENRTRIIMMLEFLKNKSF